MGVANAFDLAGRGALVTGGGGGIGHSIAVGLSSAGAEVAILGRSDSGEQTAEAIRSNGGNSFFVRADLSSRVDLITAFDQVSERLGNTIDILVTSHGTVTVVPAISHDLEAWDYTLEVNLTAVFELCQLAGEAMIAKGRGKIINIASMYAFFGGLRVAAYTASKAGVAQLTKALANEWASSGVNVNAIAPGYVRTQLNEHIWRDRTRGEEILSRVPAGRWGEPYDLVGPTVFLASEASDYLHGVVLPVDGGFLAR